MEAPHAYFITAWGNIFFAKMLARLTGEMGRSAAWAISRLLGTKLVG